MTKVVLVLLTIGATFSASAADRPYGEAGCGLGNLAMGKDNQVLAATTNGTGIQTFGISSGTSNCVDNGTVRHAKAVPMFIEVNRFELAKDSSRGSGEMVSGLAKLMNCPASDLGLALKSNYKQVFVDSNMSPVAIENALAEVRPASCKLTAQVASR